MTLTVWTVGPSVRPPPKPALLFGTAHRVMPLRAPAELGVPSPVAPSHADRWVCAAALGLAFAAHAAVLGALLREPDDVTVGGGGQQIESISVTIVSSNVLESVVAERTQPTAMVATASVSHREPAQL